MASAALTSSAPPVCGRPRKAVMVMGWPSASALTRKLVPATWQRGEREGEVARKSGSGAVGGALDSVGARENMSL